MSDVGVWQPRDARDIANHNCSPCAPSLAGMRAASRLASRRRRVRAGVAGGCAERPDRAPPPGGWRRRWRWGWRRGRWRRRAGRRWRRRRGAVAAPAAAVEVAAGGGGGGGTAAAVAAARALARTRCTRDVQMQAESAWRWAQMTSLSSLTALRQIISAAGAGARRQDGHPDFGRMAARRTGGDVGAVARRRGCGRGASHALYTVRASDQCSPPTAG